MSTPRHNYAKLSDVDEAAADEIQMESLASEQQPAVVAVAEVDSNTENVAAAASSSAAAVAASVAAQQNDGVFSNVAPLPPKYEDDRLPAYGEVFSGENAPHVPFGIVTATVSADDMLIDGLPIGSGFTFILTMLISWLFGIFGFLCAFLMSTSHAGRNGALAGIGLQLIHWGIYMRSYMDTFQWYVDNASSYAGSYMGSSGTGETPYGSTGSNLFDDSALPLWLSYAFMLLGWFIFVRACLRLFQVRRILHLRLAGLLDASQA